MGWRKGFIEICRWGKEMKSGLSQQEHCQENGPFPDHSIAGTAGKLNCRIDNLFLWLLEMGN
jgi:hypothetical protein